MSLIPVTPGADWRDLPNKVHKLRNGVWTEKLKYTHHDKAKGKGAGGAKRGVCKCAETQAGSKCRDAKRQADTIIPWCLPHTSNR